MKIIRSVNEMMEFSTLQRERGMAIGFVPTMGSLHEGHLSLVEESIKHNPVTVVSIFVNPTQFNDPKDFERYPRNEEEDLKRLAKYGVDVVFIPYVEEIYPDKEEQPKRYKLGKVAEVMEGIYRPGHFQGVAIIVDKLFRIVNPVRAYFGEKDFQQIAVIKNMASSEGLDVDIIPCPIKRGEDGLALSSRNELLSPELREKAPEIYSTLKYSVEYSNKHSVRATHDTVVERLDSVPGMKVEYFEIVDARTLLPVEEWEESDWIIGCITVFCGEIRLIDNITYRHP
ncbi:MAG: pantoate--beta-alanine ligase [Muribaculaceae bacterium]|nr:pantoate--beta-alanine ligase [Muribaculaceae bacterium]